MHQLFDKLLNWKNDLIKLYIFLFFYMYNPKTEQHFQFVKKNPFNSEHNSTCWHICIKIWTKKVTGGHSCVEIRNKKVQKNWTKLFNSGEKTFNVEQHFMIENKTLRWTYFHQKSEQKNNVLFSVGQSFNINLDIKWERGSWPASFLEILRWV